MIRTLTGTQGSAFVSLGLLRPFQIPSQVWLPTAGSWIWSKMYPEVKKISFHFLLPLTLLTVPLLLTLIYL